MASELVREEIVELALASIQRWVLRLRLVINKSALVVTAAMLVQV